MKEIEFERREVLCSSSFIIPVVTPLLFFFFKGQFLLTRDAMFMKGMLLTKWRVGHGEEQTNGEGN